MFFNKKFLNKSYFHVSLCLVFLFSGSVIGCLQEKSPSPLERKLQEIVHGSTGWLEVATVDAPSDEQLTRSVKMEKITEQEQDKYKGLIELIPLHQE